MLGWIFSRLGSLGDTLAPIFLHPMVSRHYYGSELLREVNESQPIALIDSRDVIFWSDPFERLDGRHLIVAEEDTCIEENEFTLWWMRQLSRALSFDMTAMLSKAVICGGVTLGTAGCLRTYLGAFVKAATSSGMVIGASGGFDQGLHNILLRSKAIAEAAILPVGNSLIAHLCGNWSEVFNLDIERGVVKRRMVL